jgi:hypothetical protein
MPKTKPKSNPKSKNPFLTKLADTLWQHLDEGMKPVSKKELVKRAKALKRNYLNK